MKVTLDPDQLLADGKITRDEYEKLGQQAAKSTGSLAFNILTGFGVIAVSGAALALVPAPLTAVVIGLCVLVFGLLILRSGSEQWKVLANIRVLVGALMTGGGMVAAAKGSLASILPWRHSLLYPVVREPGRHTRNRAHRRAARARVCGGTAKCERRNERTRLATGWNRRRENATPPRPDREAVGTPRCSFGHVPVTLDE